MHWLRCYSHIHPNLHRICFNHISHWWSLPRHFWLSETWFRPISCTTTPKPESLGGAVFWYAGIFSSKKNHHFPTEVFFGRFRGFKTAMNLGTEASFDSPWADPSAVSKTWRISSCFQHPRFYNPMGALKRYQYQKERKVVLQPSFFKDCWWNCGADLKVWAWFENMEYFTSRFLLRFKNAMKLPMHMRQDVDAMSYTG